MKYTLTPLPPDEKQIVNTSMSLLRHTSASSDELGIMLRNLSCQRVVRAMLWLDAAREAVRDVARDVTHDVA